MTVEFFHHALLFFPKFKKTKDPDAECVGGQCLHTGRMKLGGGIVDILGWSFMGGRQ